MRDNSNELIDRVQRLMQQVDYYLHCELDAEYLHDQPQEARRQLEKALQEELSSIMSHRALESHH